MADQATTDGMRFLELITDLQIDLVSFSELSMSKCASVPVTNTHTPNGIEEFRFRLGFSRSVRGQLNLRV